MKKTKTVQLILCALFAALTAVFSQLAVPIGPIPVNLATLAVLCAGALLGSKLGALSLTVWVALGAFGVPVFSMFRSGPGALFGPTGGFIFGYIAAAFLVGLFTEKLNKSGKIFLYASATLTGAAVYFTLGVAWYMISSGTGLAEALTLCVIPFIPGDLLKMAVATVLAHRLRPILSMRINTQRA